ncbi:DUF3304 domain-containing protein [Atlantibacter hermannii]|uniref:DUF3304 domain-containing protein n=1 Tax=Atlantibacter hermannii TaxID=565 RepID=UPI0019343745|nr:DUF3304 domain-containing protein [Atlantibacter hermannii]MBL7638091.1 DUF3304 domain-containing protein [Atlantibacter hermannii]
MNKQTLFSASGRRLSAGLVLLGGMVLFGLAACKGHGQKEPMSGADLNVFNHGPDGIVWVKANGYGGPGANSYGGGGGYCCVMVPDVWRPGLTAQITWLADPNANIDPQTKENSGSDWAVHHKAGYRRHGPVTVELERWEKGQDCGFNVHIFPCDEVHITRSCRSPSDPRWPYMQTPEEYKKQKDLIFKGIKEKIVCPKP